MALQGCEGRECLQPASQPLRYNRYPRPLSVSLSPDQPRPMLLATIYWRGGRAGLPLVCIAEGGYLVAVHVPTRIEAAGVVPQV